MNKVQARLGLPETRQTFLPKVLLHYTSVLVFTQFYYLELQTFLRRYCYSLWQCYLSLTRTVDTEYHSVIDCSELGRTSMFYVRYHIDEA